MDSKDLVLIDDQTLNRIKKILIRQRETVSVAESVTAGIIQTALASAVDASKFFHGGITVYNLGQKARHLHINSIHAEDCNCVSTQVEQEMASNVCRLFASDWGIGVTGYATIDPDIKNKQPFAHFSIAYKCKIIKSGILKHDEGDPSLIQYFYVSEILKTFLQILSSKRKILRP